MRALNLNEDEEIELNIDLINTLLSNGGGIIDLGGSGDRNSTEDLTDLEKANQLATDLIENVIKNSFPQLNNNASVTLETL